MERGLQANFAFQNIDSKTFASKILSQLELRVVDRWTEKGKTRVMAGSFLSSTTSSLSVGVELVRQLYLAYFHGVRRNEGLTGFWEMIARSGKVSGPERRR